MPQSGKLNGSGNSTKSPRYWDWNEMGKKRRGSPKGKISFLERLYNFWKQKILWLIGLIFYGIGEAASYISDNPGALQSALPWWGVAGVFGAVGVVLMMRDNQKIKNTDTLEEERTQ